MRMVLLRGLVAETMLNSSPFKDGTSHRSRVHSRPWSRFCVSVTRTDRAALNRFCWCRMLLDSRAPQPKGDVFVRNLCARVLVGSGAVLYHRGPPPRPPHGGSSHASSLLCFTHNGEHLLILTALILHPINDEKASETSRTSGTGGGDGLLWKHLLLLLTNGSFIFVNI